MVCPDAAAKPAQQDCTLWCTSSSREELFSTSPTMLQGEVPANLRLIARWGILPSFAQRRSHRCSLSVSAARQQKGRPGLHLIPEEGALKAGADVP